MLKNDNRVLKNDGRLLKAQAVDSYYETPQAYYINLRITLSGTSTVNPFKMYVLRLGTMVKFNYTSDVSYQQVLIAPSSESSYKKFYFFGNLDALRSFETQHDSLDIGDFVSFINQFPRLEHLYLYKSSFNDNIGYSRLPSTLKYLSLWDTTITGNISTIENFRNLEDVFLMRTPFTGDLNNINFTNLKQLRFYEVPSVVCDVNELMDDNPLINYFYVRSCPNFTGNLTNFNPSGLTFFLLQHTAGFTGDITDWTFNNNFHDFYLYTTSSVYGDITNWDFSNTDCVIIDLRYSDFITGDLSGWTLPNGMTQIYLYQLGISSIPPDLSNCTEMTTFNCYDLPSLTSISGTTFPVDLSDFRVRSCTALIDDINNINLTSGMTTILLSSNALTGNINEFTVPSETTDLELHGNNITGYLSGMTFNSKLYRLYLGDNLLTGSIVGTVIPNTLRYLTLSYNDIYIDFDAGTFSTNQLIDLNLSNISGITGDFANLVMPNNLSYLYLNNTPITGDLNGLDVSKTTGYLYINNSSLAQDVTNMFTGTTTLSILDMSGNPNLSGDTTNWNISSTQTIYLFDTKLSGALTHNNIYGMNIRDTLISSNIGTDFNFINRGRTFQGQDCELTGSLSGVTLYSGMYTFYVHNNPNVTGMNAFVDYLFVNRKYFTYNGVSINMSGCGEAVTGASETLGDIGTFPSGTTYAQWNLTEEQVNNLVIGTDYDGLGTNTPWNSKQKIYWMKNAKISSTNLNKRYVTYTITY
jgi:hypothetical protein